MLIHSVGIKGMTAPSVTIDTVMQLKVFSEKLIKIRKAWGALSMTSDGMVVVTSTLSLIMRKRTLTFSAVLPLQI